MARDSSPGRKSDLGLEAFQGAIADEGLPLGPDGPGTLPPVAPAAGPATVRPADPYAPLPAENAGPAEFSAEDQAPSNADDACDVSPRTIVEAMLFVGGRQETPLAASEIAALMRGVRPQEIDSIVAELNASFEADGCPYAIESVGAGYRLTLRAEFRPIAERFLARSRGTRLSPAAVDVLAIVAYQQPVTREALDRLRGKPSNALLNQLVRRQLIRLEHSPDSQVPPQYFTTDRFLKLFGLASLEELPYSQDAER